jgi:hypothetical protein
VNTRSTTAVVQESVDADRCGRRKDSKPTIVAPQRFGRTDAKGCISAAVWNYLAHVDSRENVMRERQGLSPEPVSLISAIGAGLLAGSVFSASPASATLPNCAVSTLSQFRAASVSITSATEIRANGPTPEYCSIQGSVTTSGEGAGSAEFVLKLPASWNNRLVFFGCGSNCGSVKDVAANPADTLEALGLGYAVVNTDGGHEQDPTTPDPTWVLLAPGVPNEPAIIDFFYRAVHQTAVAMKTLAQDYYSDKIEHAYFDGCSTGGRQSVMEGDRYPEDFDGLIAGDPIIDADTQRAASNRRRRSCDRPRIFRSR